MNHKIAHSLVLTSLVTFTGAVFRPQMAQATSLIVVDFDVNGGTTGTNWNQITPNVQSISNLVDVDGNNTGFSFGLGGTMNPPIAFESGDPDSTQIPTGSPITTAIGGNITGDIIAVDYWFTGLEPGALFRIYVFSYRNEPYFNQISVETQQTIPAYDVTSNEDFGEQDLYVNQEIGMDGRTLVSYANVVSVWDEGPNIGGIGLEFIVNGDAGFDDQWAIAGIAIQEVPIPEPSSLLGLGLIGGGMIARSLLKKLK